MAGVSIVVPTVNEADNIDPLFERIFAAEIPENVFIEIVVVDDSSNDDTRDRVRTWAKKNLLHWFVERTEMDWRMLLLREQRRQPVNTSWSWTQI